MKKFKVKIQIRFKDIDAIHHVNNAVYFTYFEIGRLEFFRNVVNDIELKKYPIVLARIEANFLKPITIHHSEVILYMWAGGFGNKSFKFYYEIFSTNGKIKFAEGESIQVFYDYKNNKSFPVPKSFIEIIKEYISE